MKKVNWLKVSTLSTGLILVGISVKVFWDKSCSEFCGMQHYQPGIGFVGGQCVNRCDLANLNDNFPRLGLFVFVVGTLFLIYSMSKRTWIKK